MMTLLAAFLSAASVDDAEIVRALKEKGASARESNGSVTSLEAGNCSAWTDEDFTKLSQLAHLKSLSFGPGLTDHSFELLAGCAGLEVLQTNECRATDDGVKALARLKKLKILKFFHPGKAFSGKGLSALAEMPALESLTVAGSLSFGDEGMAAACTLTRLKELRTWHAGQTIQGVQKLTALKNLKSLTLGQRLAYKPPTTLSDDTLAVLAELKSLETLRLEEARLKADSLLRLKELPALKTLVLEGIDLPEADVERLRTELPKVKLQWTKPNETYLKRIHALFD